MDFGVVGFEGFVGSDTAASSGLTLAASDSETKQKLCGSGFLKQERSGNGEEDDSRGSKLAKFDDFSATKPMLSQQRNGSFPSNNTSVFFDGQQQPQMLSFSAPKSEALSMDRSSQNAMFPYYHLTSPAYTKHTGYSGGANMNGGAFTQSQWMELEHQALIYKYMTANVPIPSNLLIPIRKALHSAGFSTFSGGLIRPNSLGWGAFHLGFSNNTDPEPGRCRRTDGKKWRCSRDAVADQKYCERHMNRGRHRSRKHVEGQSGRSTTATTATATTAKLVHTVSSSSASVVVGPTSGSGESYSLTIAQQQFKNMQPAGKSNLSESAPMNSLLLNKETMGERAPGNEFGVVSSESLLNPSHKSPSLVKCIDFNCAQHLYSQKTQTHHSGWPKTQCDRPSISWPEPDKTQLSISIPVAVSDFMSSTSSPSNETVTYSPLQLDPVLMGLGVGNETNRRQANWIPITWETSMGGPLGEALHSTNSNTSDCRNSSALNHTITKESWDHSPRFGSSPTGVLQKTMFGSHSNSSAGSSPRAENNKNDHGSTIVHSS